MADNDLESSLREDLLELIQSPAITEESLTTWIYFDHRNVAGDDDWFETDKLPEVYNANGSSRSGRKPTGSLYLRFDHRLKKMVVDTILPGEQNSDAPETVYEFAKKGLSDCVSKRGASKMDFMIAFSSHGGGFDGFGGDENTRARRNLGQSNPSIVQALQRALADVSTAPDKFDVIGFDACLMQAVGAVDEYRDVAKYFLASEATEPGHGWAYNAIDDVSSALNFAKQIQKTFLSMKQGSDHDTPKTLAIVDTDAFTTFLSNWEALCMEMSALIDGKDPEFFPTVKRARMEAVAFEGILDGDGTKFKSAVDVGSFLQNLKKGCPSTPGSSFYSVVEAAQSSYDAMYVATGNGPGTRPGTGMHITWPVHEDYRDDKDDFDEYLFEKSKYATKDAPQWLAFLKKYYATTTPGQSKGVSVCSADIASDGAVDEDNDEGLVSENGLLISPFVSDMTGLMSHTVTTGISRDLDHVTVEYGLDITNSIPSNNRRNLRNISRRLGNKVASARPNFPRRVPITMDRKQRLRRRLQAGGIFAEDDDESGDYLYLFGGDLDGEYDSDGFSTVWDRQFFGLTGGDDGKIDLAYTLDVGYGEKEIPVIYIPRSRQRSGITRDDLSFGMQEEDVIEMFDGAEYGYLSFSILNGTDSFSLYTYNDESGDLSETPFSVGGQVVPVVNVMGSINGLEVSTLAGGLNRAVFNLADLSIVNYDATFVASELGFPGCIIDILAYKEFSIGADMNITNSTNDDISLNGTMADDDDISLNGTMADDDEFDDMVSDYAIFFIDNRGVVTDSQIW